MGADAGPQPGTAPATAPGAAADDARFRIVVERFSEGMLVIQDERIVFANPRASDITQMSLADMQAVGVLHRVHPDDCELVFDRQRRRLAGEVVPDHYELRLLLPGDVVRWIAIGVSVVPWGERPAVLIFLSDITETKATVQALTRSEERYRAVVEHVGQGMVVVQDERFVFVNQRAAEIAGRSRQELMTHGFLHSIHPDDRAMVAERQRRRVAGDTVPDHYELRLLHDDGRITWVDLGVTVVPWEGRPGTLTFFSDITPRKTLEAQLLRTLQEREAVLNSALVGITFNVNRRIVWVNDKYLEMFGFAREDVIGQGTRHFYADDESHAREGVITREALQREGSYRTERRLVRRDGQAIWVQLAGRCVSGRDPDAGVIWTVLDITDRHRAEEDMREALARQRELNELRSRFVAMTSHEFRTPLASILSSAELLRHYADRMDADERDQTLSRIEHSVARMSAMLDRMLLIGKADAQMLPFAPRPTDLHALVRTVADDVRREHPAAPAMLVTELSPDTAQAQVDSELLRHILGNLLGNALKYSPGGGRVTLSLWRPEPGRLALRVRDQGLGIPADDLGHLFVAFHRARNVGAIPGTGLGLVIVKKSVEVHGGELQVHSAPGEGTTVEVRLPG